MALRTMGVVWWDSTGREPTGRDGRGGTGRDAFALGDAGNVNARMSTVMVRLQTTADGGPRLKRVHVRTYALDDVRVARLADEQSVHL